MSKKSNSSSGIGFSGLLTIVFITLKLIGKIDWSWWWVWCPIWIPVAAFLGGFIIYLIVVLIKDRIAAHRGWLKVKKEIDEMKAGKKNAI